MSTRLMQVEVVRNDKQGVAGFHVFKSDKPFLFPNSEPLGNDLYRVPFTIDYSLTVQAPSALDMVFGQKEINAQAAQTKAVQSIAKPCNVQPEHQQSGRDSAVVDAGEHPERASQQVTNATRATNLSKHERQRFNGHSMTGLIRALGKAKWTFEQTKQVLVTKLHYTLADSTINAWLQRGARGIMGEPAALTKDDWKQLNSLR